MDVRLTTATLKYLATLREEAERRLALYNTAVEAILRQHQEPPIDISRYEIDWKTGVIRHTTGDRLDT